MDYTYQMNETNALIYNGEQVISTLEFSRDENGYQILSIRTNEAYQGQQLAKKLLYYFIEHTNGERVIPICSYAVHAFEKDDELAKLTK